MNKVFITLLLLISLPAIAMDDMINDDPELVQADKVAQKRAAKIVALSNISTKLKTMHAQLRFNQSMCPEKTKQAIDMISRTSATFNNIQLIIFALERYPHKNNDETADLAIFNFTLQESYLNAAIINILTPTSDDLAFALNTLSLTDANNSTNGVGNGLSDSDLVYN